MKKKIWGALLTAGAIMTGLTACGANSQNTGSNTSNTTGSGSATEASGTATAGGSGSAGDVSLKVWVDPGSDQFYNGVVQDYLQNNGKSYTVEVIESDTGKAQEYVKKDPDAAADIFSMPHDQLGQLVEAGVIYENTKYGDSIKATSTAQAASAAEYGGKTYGVESMMLYYDKSKLTAEDVLSFETLTSKAAIGLNFEEGGGDYFAVPFFIANGALLYGENGEDAAGTTFHSPQGVSVLKWISSQKENSNVIQANSDLMSKLEEGSIAALVSGPWGKENVEKILGDNMGIAVYPTVDFGDGEVQMKAFLGVKLYGVNANTKHPLEAMEIADYLASEAVQELAFTDRGTIPSNTQLQNSDLIAGDLLASVVTKMAAPEHSVLMPKIPEMVSFWPSALAVINDAYKGNINEDQMMGKLEQLVADTSVVNEQ